MYRRQSRKEVDRHPTPDHICEFVVRVSDETGLGYTPLRRGDWELVPYTTSLGIPSRLVPVFGPPRRRDVCQRVGVAASGLGVLGRLDRQFPGTIAS